MPRRRLLAASAATLPLLLATASCNSSDLFAGPDPLGARPPLAHDTVVLEAAITAETRLISLYKLVMPDVGNRASQLAPLLAQHEEHLAKLRGRLIVPAGASPVPASESAPSVSGAAPSVSGAAPSVSGAASSASAAARDPIAGLRAAERESAATLVRQLANVHPALAQLLASIAASDATHVTALSSL